MSKLKHFTIIEVGNNECPMIGTIDNVTNDKVGIENFKERLKGALEDSFDLDLEKEFENIIIPDLFCGSPYEDVLLIIDNQTYTIRIIETWFS